MREKFTCNNCEIPVYVITKNVDERNYLCTKCNKSFYEGNKPQRFVPYPMYFCMNCNTPVNKKYKQLLPHLCLKCSNKITKNHNTNTKSSYSGIKSSDILKQLKKELDPWVMKK